LSSLVINQAVIAKPKIRINERINTPEVRVIDDKGEMLGVMSTDKALELARSKNLDLIEISPKAQPPVVKVVSYDKYRYQVEKAEAKHRKRQKKTEVKGIRVSVRIGKHDMDFKAKQADKFLSKGNKIKVEMFLRGRERANLDFAFEVLDKFMNTLTEKYLVEQNPKKAGHVISVMIGPETKQKL
jgi:translation initiation factor IF-3